MARSLKYPTMEERPPVRVRITRFTKQEVRDANAEFRKDAYVFSQETQRKLCRSATSISTRTYVCR